MIKISEINKFKSVLTEVKIVAQDHDFQIKTDNNNLDEKSIFIIFIGKSYDPLDHLDKVLASGCEYIVCEKNKANLDKLKNYTGKIILTSKIEDFVIEAGHKIAESFKNRGTLIGISGSNGKTTTKEMLYHLLMETLGDRRVICTQKNNNNHLGVPFSLFQISPETEVAIIELGSNHPGEMKVICDLLKPDFGVTTNIGDAHLEFFEDREGVFKEESYLEKVTSKKFYINKDDKYLRNILPSEKKVFFGRDSSTNKMIVSSKKVIVAGIELENNFITGDHNFQNLGVAFIIAKDLYPAHIDSMADSARSFKPTINRSQWLRLGDNEVFLDAYNANPSSMKLSIKGFIDHIDELGIKRDQVALVLGDMNELGAKTEELHQEIGKFAVSFNVGCINFVGRFADFYKSDNTVGVNSYKSTDDFVSYFAELKLNYKYLFIKGSRSLQLESLIDIN